MSLGPLIPSKLGKLDLFPGTRGGVGEWRKLGTASALGLGWQGQGKPFRLHCQQVGQPWPRSLNPRPRPVSGPSCEGRGPAFLGQSQGLPGEWQGRACPHSVCLAHRSAKNRWTKETLFRLPQPGRTPTTAWLLRRNVLTTAFSTVYLEKGLALQTHGQGQSGPKSGTLHPQGRRLRDIGSQEGLRVETGQWTQGAVQPPFGSTGS